MLSSGVGELWVTGSEVFFPTPAIAGSDCYVWKVSNSSVLVAFCGAGTALNLGLSLSCELRFAHS